MASPTWWAWVWVNSGSWWWTGRPGVLQFMGVQRIGHDWMAELNWTECDSNCALCKLTLVNTLQPRSTTWPSGWRLTCVGGMWHLYVLYGAGFQLPPSPTPTREYFDLCESPGKTRISTTVTPLGNILQEIAKKSLAKKKKSSISEQENVA